MRIGLGYNWVAALAMVLLPASLISCGDEATNEPLGVSNVSPEGSVGGIIVDAVTLSGVKNVSVSVMAGGKVYAAAAKTDATGQFSVVKVPAGAIIVLITPAAESKYMPVTIATNLANAAGEFPLANSTLSVGPVGLVPKASATEAFRVQILTADGAPAQQITATLTSQVRWVDYTKGNAAAKGSTMVEGKTGGSG